MSIRNIWVRSEDEVWTTAEILSEIDNGQYIIKHTNSKGRVNINEKYTVTELDILEVCDTQVDDLTQMIHLNEANILEAIHKRYRESNIYTKTGEVLLAVNPFKNLEIYDIEDYELNIGPERPHVYYNAKLCMERLISRHRPQSILVSGESGAGKTQTTKYIMKYLSHQSQKHLRILNSGNLEHESATNGGIESILLESNPILESFGNSKTRRNENSSRFGKYVKIHFNNNIIQGASIETYLLETIRLTQHHKQELNFHLVYGVINYYRDQGLLDSNTNFHYANEGITPYIKYSTTTNAMKAMEFSDLIINSIGEIIMGILHLGNFHSQTDTLDTCSKYLGLDTELTMSTLTSRSRKIAGETIVTQLTKSEIISSRDTLAKAIYGSLFKYIVKQINTTINVRDLHHKDNTSSTSLPISILDIFGFEVFDQNGFEQLCINYTNERLQCLFNSQMIQAQQVEYQEEGLTWEPIAFSGNELCLSQLDKSLYPLLDEATSLASSDDNAFVSRLKRNNSYSHILFPKQDPPPYFTVKHFAGAVDYKVGSFTDRNIDAIHPQLLELLNTTTNPLIKTLTSYIPKKVVSSLAFKSISHQFRSSLHKLIEELKGCQLHYIRCLKPNDQDLPDHFGRSRIVEQLRYSGVLEAVKVARAGYPIRMLHDEYNTRYSQIPNFSEAKEGVVKGNTKFFIKNNAYIKLESDLSCLRTESSIAIQSGIRRYLTYHWYQNLKINVVRVQSYIRRYNDVLKLRKHQYVRQIQTCWRRFFRERQYHVLFQSLLLIQIKTKQWLVRRQHYRLVINNFVNYKLNQHSYKRKQLASITICRFFRKLQSDNKRKIKRAQQELREKTEELHKVLLELDNKKQKDLEQQTIIKNLEQQNIQIQEQQKQLESNNIKATQLHKRCRQQEKRNREVIEQNNNLQTDIIRMQETVRRNNGTKLEILGEMETLVKENIEIKERLDQYNKYIESMNSLNQTDHRCSIQ